MRACGRRPGYVHKLLADTWQPNGVDVSPRGAWQRDSNYDNATVGASAQASDDGKTVVVRITNSGDTPAAISLSVKGFSGGATKPTTWLLEAPPLAGSTWWPDKGGTNPHDEPTLISPKRGSARVGLGLGLGAGGGDALALPPFAYEVLTVSTAGTKCMCALAT